MNSPATNLKPTAVDRRLTRWIKQHCDARDIVVDPFQQRTNERVEQHLNAVGWQDRLPSVTEKQVAAHRHTNATVRIRPQRQTSNPSMAIRVDVDQHNGQTDGRALLDKIVSELGLNAYCEESPKGFSGYIVVEGWPEYDIDGLTRWISAANMNRHIDRFQDALQRLAHSWGFAASVEVNGRFTLTCRDEDSYRHIISRGGHFRAPRCKTMDDVQRLENASTTYGSTLRIINAASRLPAPTKTAAQGGAPAGAIERVKLFLAMCEAEDRQEQPTSKLEASGNKFHDRSRCVSQAIRELGIEGDTELLVSRANAIYEAAGLNSGSRDDDRDECFRGIIEHFRQTYDPDAMGSGTLWFDDPDLKRAADLTASRISNEALDARNAKLRRSHSPLMTRAGLAIVLCTIGKNVSTNEGACPIAAIVRMLHHFDLRANVATASAYVYLLITAGFTSTNRRYAEGFCRKYQLDDLTYSLPFLIEVKADLDAKRAAERQASRYVAAGAQCNDRSPIVLPEGYVCGVNDQPADDQDFDPANSGWDLTESGINDEICTR